MERKTLEFSALPLVETHIRIAFEQSILLTFQAARDLAGAMESVGFKRVVNENVLRQAPGQSLPVNFMFGTLLALSCETEQGVRVRIQPDMIEAEWLRDGGAEYPRFLEMLKAIDQTVKCVKATVAPDVKFTIANISYSILLEFGSAPTVSLINQYINFQFGAPGSHDAVHLFEVAWSGDIDHRLTMQAFVSAPSDPPSKIIATTAAGVRLQSGANLEAELTRIHDFLIDWFYEMLTEKARNEFGYES
jgi:hypothetical protein